MLLSTATIFASIASTVAGAAASSLVPGKAFDRLAVIFLENTDYDKAYGDRKHHVLAPAYTLSDDNVLS